jgi:hypothetical protein
MDEAEKEGDAVASYVKKHDNVIATAALGSQRALLAMAKILRETAASLRAKEAGHGTQD